MDSNKENNIHQYEVLRDALIATKRDLNRDYWNNNYSYSIEEAEDIVNSSSFTRKINLSRTFFENNGFYKRIILYYASLLKYSYMVLPIVSYGYNITNESLQKKMRKVLNFLDNMNIPDFFTKMSVKVLVDGNYYGVLNHVSKNNIIKIDLPTLFCRNRMVDIYGNDVVEFNVSYFDTIADPELKESTINSYPNIIKEFYYSYKNGIYSYPWIIIPSDIGIHFNITDDCSPFFINIIPAAMRYSKQVDIEQEASKEEIRKVLIQKVPHLTDGTLLFEPDEAAVMHKGAADMLSGNKNISVLTTYADVDAIVSKTANESNDNIQKMMQNIYNEGTTSFQIFSPTGNLSVETSINNDTSLMMILANKYSKFISFLINKIFKDSRMKYNFKILPITYYNEEKQLSNAMKLAQSGGSLLYPSIVMGINQNELSDLKDYENKVLKLLDKLKPLSSSYTQSSEAGRPEIDNIDKAPRTLDRIESDDKSGGNNG